MQISPTAIKLGAPRVRRSVVISLCLAALSGGLAESGAATAATAVRAQCTTVLNVSVSRGAFTASSGSASCTGRLGPWIMGGQSGWSVGAGRLPGTVVGPGGGAGACLADGGHVDVLSSAPRFAWLHPRMVTLRDSLTLHRAGAGLAVSGAGQLLVTRDAPVARSLVVSGTAALRATPGSSCSAAHWTGTLTLRLTVDSQP